MWLFVHLAFLNGFGHRLAALWRWGPSMVGTARPERVFSVGHTGGDLSLPDDVKAKVMPKPFPIFESDVRLARPPGAGGRGRSSATLGRCATEPPPGSA